MDCKIFYSWQSDLPNNTNRGFIGDALEKAVKSISNDDSITVEPVIDRDTKNVTGSPDIVNTIFDKIEQAQIFVCDVSIVGNISIFGKDTKFRPTPNPNVLIELGYAMKTLGEGKIIMVINTAFGFPEQLPFDLRMRRIIPYNMPVDNQEKSPERNNLAKDFERAIRPILPGLEKEIPQEIYISEQAEIAVKNSQPNKIKLVREFIKYLTNEIQKLAHKFSAEIVENENTVNLVIEFATLAESIATAKSSDVAVELYEGFERIIAHYNYPLNYSNCYETKIDADANFHKFMGYELFVIYFSFLIRENCWNLITKLLEKDFYVENPFPYAEKPSAVPFYFICQSVNPYQDCSKMLNHLHTNGKIAEIV
ncbi:MAG: hypothetical protein AAGJ08_20390 [Cyanobacteria bacterium P01_H01_bin.35]